MDKNTFALLGLIVEGCGFVVIWFLGGMDGALSRLQSEQISIEGNLKRLKEIQEIFNKNIMSQVMSTSGLGAPVMGFVLPNNELNMYLHGLIDREQVLLDKLKDNIDKRKFKRIFIASRGTAFGFLLVILGLIMQCKAVIG